jgi:3-phenylpropionate/cinnamic acid dioxygenase small subunit
VSQELRAIARRAAIPLGLLVLACAFPAYAPGASPAADARMQQLEDRLAIEHLLMDYGRTLDNRDFAAYSKLFAVNGEWKGALGTYRGPAAIHAAMEKIFTDAATDIPRGRNFHVMSNFDISVQGDRATARSMFIFYKMEGSKPEAAVAGRYEDILIRENGVWRFLQRTALPPG